jgi:YggT family protein
MRAAACRAAFSPLNERPFAGSGAAMRAILDVLLLILQIYTYIIIVVAIMSWLIAFNVINVHNNVVRSIWNALNAVTEPLLKPIRNILPAFGGLDISPVILLLLIFLVQDIIERYVYPNVF